MKHEVGVAAVLFDNYGNVLLEHRKKEFGHGLMVLVGGGLDEHDPVAGVRREIKEEIGVEADLHLMPVYFANDKFIDGSPYLMLYYTAYLERGTERNMEPAKCYGLVWRPIPDIVGATDMWVNDKLAVGSADALLHLWERRVINHDRT
jgi:8-oxo-dGTP pyrophosphatase MutT (NUDIX family)